MYVYDILKKETTCQSSNSGKQFEITQKMELIYFVARLGYCKNFNTSRPQLTGMCYSDVADKKLTNRQRLR